jgi:hypothetical protein
VGDDGVVAGLNHAEDEPDRRREEDVMKRIVWMILPVLVFCHACSERDTATTGPVFAKTPDMVTEEGGITAAYFDAANLHTIDMLGRALDDPAVTAEIAGYEARGYTLAPEHAFVAEGTRDDGGEVVITTIAMEGCAESDRDVVYLLCLHGIDRNVIVPLTLKFTKDAPAGEFERIGDDAWLGFPDGAPPASGFGDINAAAARISWRQWLGCVTERIVAGGASCAFLCRFAFGGYLHCVAVCTAGHAIYAFLYCSFQQL